MRFFPLGLDVRGRPCLVVGGGEVGTRKAGTLARAGAEVTVLAPQVTEALAGMVQDGTVRWVPDSFLAHHLDGVFLAVAATDDHEANALLVKEARDRGILVCDASSAERSQVIFGALHEGEGLVVAVFTDGQDPSRARSTRDRIRRLLSREKDGPGLGGS